MTIFQRALAALVGAAFGAILSVSLMMTGGVTSQPVLLGIPAVGAVAGALWGDRGLRAVLRAVGILG